MLNTSHSHPSLNLNDLILVFTTSSRYDESCSGEVDYSEFVEKLMENDFKGVSGTSQKALRTLVSSTFLNQDTGNCLEGDDDSDVDEEELETFRRTEVKRLFDIVDNDKSSFVDKDEMVDLLHGLGKTLSLDQIDEGFAKLDTDSSGKIDFEEFYTWYKTVAFGNKSL